MRIIECDRCHRRIEGVVVDGETIKADTWYTLNDDGDVVEEGGAE